MFKEKSPKVQTVFFEVLLDNITSKPEIPQEQEIIAEMVESYLLQGFTSNSDWQEPISLILAEIGEKRQEIGDEAFVSRIIVILTRLREIKELKSR